MSFNIRYGTARDGDNAWPNRRDLCMATIEGRDADIIGLQEALAFQLDEIRRGLPGYTLVGVGRDDGLRKGEYAPLLIRTDRFAVDRARTVWFSETPEVPGSKDWGNNITRICTWVRLIDLRTGKALWVYNMHLDHQSQLSRERSAELVGRLIAERPDPAEPVIIMGDMNAGESNPALRYYRGEIASASGRDDAPPSPHLVDTYRAVHPDQKQVGSFTGFKDERDGEKIDHLLVSSGVEIVDADIDRTRGEDGRCPSDHDAVWATVVPGGG
jgi:endonuclease/exonuclease/phosphatase family metal-dependent hydrolase